MFSISNHHNTIVIREVWSQPELGAALHGEVAWGLGSSWRFVRRSPNRTQRQSKGAEDLKHFIMQLARQAYRGQSTSETLQFCLLQVDKNLQELSAPRSRAEFLRRPWIWGGARAYDWQSAFQSAMSLHPHIQRARFSKLIWELIVVHWRGIHGPVRVVKTISKMPENEV